MKHTNDFSLTQKVRIIVKSWSLWLIFKLVSSTWRVQIIDQNAALKRTVRGEQRAVFAVFHHSYLIPFHVNRHQNFATLTADNEAGEVLSRMIHHLGYTTPRVSGDGNARTDARAAINMIEALKSGHPGAIAVDGPLGPFEKVKPGIFAIAKKSTAKIFPGAAAGRREIVLHKRWDKFRIPLPFTRVVALVGDEFIPSEQQDEQSVKNDCERLERTLKELDLKVRQYLNEKYIST